MFGRPKLVIPRFHGNSKESCGIGESFFITFFLIYFKYIRLVLDGSIWIHLFLIHFLLVKPLFSFSLVPQISVFFCCPMIF